MEIHEFTYLLLHFFVGDEEIERLLDGRLADLPVQVKEDVVDRVGPILRRQVGQHLLGRRRLNAEIGEMTESTERVTDRDVEDTYR